MFRERTVLDPILDRLSGRPPSPYFSQNQRPGLPRKRYLIAMTARTGSTFLCSRIAEFGQLGYPMEFLNETYVGEFDRVFPSPSLADYERHLATTFSSPNGVFGVKADWWQFQESRRLGFVRDLIDPLDLIIHLRREDFVAQAVSVTLAAETGVWHAREVHQEDLSAWHQGSGYDQATIETKARQLLDQEFYWRRFMKDTGVPILELTYEQIAAGVDETIFDLAHALGVPLSDPPASANAIRKTTSVVGGAWVERFHAERREFVSFWTQNRGLMTASPPQ
jgi:LPS sulfotransferase NodH